MVRRLTALQRWGQIQKLRVLNNLRTHVAETPAEGLARSGALAPLRSGARLTPGDSKFLSCHCLHSVCILYVHCHFQCQAVGSSMLMGGKVSPFKWPGHSMYTCLFLPPTMPLPYVQTLAQNALCLLSSQQHSIGRRHAVTFEP